MIICRAPLRLPMGGGGTDLPSYYSKFGGSLVGAALDKYVYIAVNRRFERDLRVSYSITEIAPSPDHVRHRVVKEALNMLGIREGVEIVSIADVPSSTGLGSSGTFTVCLLQALHAYLHHHDSPQDIAEQACEIEINRLEDPVGKQDQYLSAFGGITCLDIDKDGTVHVSDLGLPSDTLAELERCTLLFYTGIKRQAPNILAEQSAAFRKDHQESVERMHKIKEIGFQVRDALKSGDLHGFGELLHQHWETKRGLSNKISSDKIDYWYSVARKAGAIGGKIVGAGGGGFFMFYCDNNQSALREAMRKEGLEETRYRIDLDGSKVIVNF